MNYRIPLLASFRRALTCVLATITAALSLPAQTTYTSIPLDCGGWFSGFAQADDGRLYGFGDVFGAWRSDNGGNNWTYLNWSIPDFSIFGQGIAVQKNNANVVFYRSDTSLYKSTDGGATWSKKLGDLGIDDKGAPFYRGSSSILIRSNNPNEIWLAAPRKNQTGTVWLSTNGGDTWAKAGGTAFDSNPAITFHNGSSYPNHIWIGSAGGLYVSTNGGSSFTRIGSPSSLADVGMISRFTSGTHAGVGLVTRSNNNGGGISRITATDYNNAATYTITDSTTFDLHFGYPSGLQIFSDGTCSAWNTSGDRHGFSTNGGQLFTVRGTTLNTSVVPIWTTAARMQAAGHPDYGTDQVIEAVGNPNKWLITGGGAPMYSLDKGLSWQYFPNGNGLAAVKTYVASTSRFSTNVMYVPASDIGSAIITDGGSSGQATYSSNKSIAFLHSAQKIMEGPNAQTLLLAGIDQDNNRSALLRSTNGGSSWTSLNLAGTGLPDSYEGITKSVMSLTDANDFLVVLGEGDAPSNPGVWRSTNGGASFTQVTGLPSNLATGFRYGPQHCFIDRDATNANLRYFVSRGITLYRSTNGGSSWTPATHPFFNGSGYDWAWGFLADPVRGNNLWAAGDYRGVSVSRDGGLSWTPTAQFFNARYVSSCDGKIAIFGKAAGDTINRFYYSTNDGASFTAITDSSKNFDGVQGITVDRNGKIWVSWNSITVITPPSSGTAPAITSQPASQTVNAGANVTFTVAASGNPSPSLVWQRAVSGSSTFNNLSIGGAYSGVTSGTLTVTGTTTAMSGDRFRAVATNSQGSATSASATLTVNASAGGGGGGDINRATGGTATTSSTNSPSNEGVAQAFDGSTSTKWLAFSSSGWIRYTFGGGASWNIVRYAITSANDAPDRDPRNWQLQGSNDGTNWTTVDTRSAETFSARLQRREFTVANPGTFTSYRLNITANQSGSILQLAELELYSGAAVPAAPSISSALTRSATVGTSLSYAIIATNSPTSYGASGLPAGLSVNTSTGVISGTPSAAGTVNTTITATNSTGTGSATLVFTIAASGGGGGSTNIPLVNAGFESNESQTPTGWSTSGTSPSADYSEAWLARTGTRHLSHYVGGSSAYQVYTYQTLTGLTNGTYTVRAWTMSTGGQTEANVVVKNYGGSETTASIPTSTSTYTERVISGVQVTNGQIEIGFRSNATNGEQWIAVDDVSLTRTSP